MEVVVDASSVEVIMAGSGRPDNIDSIYYRDGVNKSLSMSILTVARRRMFDLFMDRLRPDHSTTILDIGVSDDENEGANFLEKQYPWRAQITCAGLGQGDAVKEMYPEVRYVPIEPNKRLPFPDKSFDIACSNAVIEHVGGSAQRQAFLAEHLRVARAVFLTVPNRWFFVEHHTSIPLLHYVPSLFRRVVSNTSRDHWAHVENLDFIDRSVLRKEWPLSQPPELVMTGLPIGPFSSNIALIYKGL